MASFLTGTGAKIVLSGAVATSIGLATGVIPSTWIKQNIVPALEQQASFLTGKEATEPVKTAPKVEQTAESKDEKKAVEAVAEAPKTIVPKFDVLRVEESGSVLVAGQAEGNAKVELFLPDGTVIGSTQAGPEGDFVILPDDNLKPGDYILGLAATSPDGTKVTSSETSVVKIPEPGGEVLAMVTPEGQVSRIVAKPKTLEEPAEAEASNEVKKDDEKSASVSETDKSVDETKKDFAEVSVPKVEVPKVEPKTDEEPTAAKPEKAEVASVEPATPVEPKAEEALPEAQETKKSVAEETVETKEADVTEPKETPNIQVVVEAVEIENGQIFVAGAVQRGQLVRIYINNQSIGTARGTIDDRFLLSKAYKLPEGRHLVRADVLEGTSGKVLARAEVPLIHETQVQVAAAETNEQTEPDVKSDFNSVQTPKVEKPLKQDFASVQTPSVEKPLKRDFVSVEQPRVEKPLKGDFAKVETPKVERALKEDFKDITVPKVEKPLKQDFASVKNPEVEKPLKDDFSSVTVPVVEKPLKQDFAKVETPTVEKPLKGDFAKVETPKIEKPLKEDFKKVETPTVTPLRTGRAIIIKPGDNLWRISRKTYGRGIRYTTIYNANKDQIRDPSRIYIGQIFKLPESAVE